MQELDFSLLLPLALEYGLKIVGVIVGYLVGSWVLSRIVSAIKFAVQKQGVDATLSGFLVSFLGGLFKVLLILSLIGFIGIEVTSFIAILGAAGLAIGMALSGTLQNFAGGVMLLLFKPYKVGDFVEVAGHSGSVKEIQIFNTILTTGDNKTVIIPNSESSSGSMVNYSTQSTRRVDFVFGIGYNDDIDKARSVLEKIISGNNKILQDKDKTIVVSALGDNAVDITVRVWVNSSDYWAVFFGMNESVKKTFDKEGISFPYPQRDVHLFQEK